MTGGFELGTSLLSGPGSPRSPQVLDAAAERTVAASLKFLHATLAATRTDRHCVQTGSVQPGKQPEQPALRRCGSAGSAATNALPTDHEPGCG